MRLNRLQISNFRNLREVMIHPSSRCTVAKGANGQGKTNLLEAIYFLLTLKPLRASRLGELIQFGQERAIVQGDFTIRGAERSLEVQVQDKKRQALVDGKKAQSFEEYFGGVAAVEFTPDDLAVIKGGPESRRQFLDRAVFNRYPAYLKESRSYLRALKNRNKLLKDSVQSAYLDAYDHALAKAGARLWIRRRALLAELAPKAAQIFVSVGRLNAEARFRYHPHAISDGWQEYTEAQLEEQLLEQLMTRRPRDFERGFTTVGPHTDDLEVSLGEKAARSFASQGQQRALILSWKIAEIQNLQSMLGFPPLLLLDDVSSELDPERNQYLMEYLSHTGAQFLLTTTDPKLVEKAAGLDTCWLDVQAGVVRQA